MTNQHPITPPPKLVQQWASAFYGTIIAPGEAAIDIATQAARWGADQELEACCLWMERNFDDWDNRFSDELRAARRPKPPSLKEEALKALKALDHRVTQVAGTHADTIRRALESLPDDNDGQS